jgi:hypothetical protein
MPKKITPRPVTLDDFIAEALEQQANCLPTSEKARAENLREQAKQFRKSGNPKMIRVWEESAEDFN